MYRESDLVCVAKRLNNKKRGYLVVNRLQGKHIPVRPAQALELFEVLRIYCKESMEEILCCWSVLRRQLRRLEQQWRQSGVQIYADNQRGIG